jgi:hypothetical protein
VIRRALAAALCLALVLVGQGEAVGAGQRVTIAKTSTNARIIKVPVKGGQLQVGNDLTDAVYTWDQGDPPCDPTGRTVYFGHAWRKGDGTADHWNRLRKGDIVKVAGCRFEVTRTEYWSASRRIDSLFRVGGAPQIVLFACKADDYSKRILVFARLIA